MDYILDKIANEWHNNRQDYIGTILFFGIIAIAILLQ
jgi:hypothetical protein